MKKINRNISKDKVLELFKFEDSLRKSKEWQLRYDEICSLYGTNKTQIVENEIQKTVLHMSGYCNDEDDIEEYRRIFNLWRDDRDVVNSILTMKNNIMMNPMICIGEKVPNVQLHDVGGNECMLFDFLQFDKPNVIIAGSRT